MADAGWLDRAWERTAKWVLNRQGFESRYVASVAGPLHVFDRQATSGHAPIVLLHGISSGAVPYGRLMRRLRPYGARIVVPEVAGHGFSTTPNQPLTPDLMLDSVTEMLDQLLDRPAVIFGNSMGGGIAIRYALERPDKVAGLILSAPAGAPMPPAEYAKFLEIFRMTNREDARAFVGRLFHKTPWYASLIARYTLMRFQRPQIRALIQGASTDLMLTPEQLAALKMPILMLWGESEKLLPEQQFKFFEQHLPSHAVVECMPESGHIPHLERPSALAFRITEFAQLVETL